MTKESILRTYVFCAMIAALFGLDANATAQTKHWVTAYFAGWELQNGNDGYPPVTALDWSCVTDVALFSIVPLPDGSLDSTSNTLGPSGSAAVVDAAHAAGAKVLVSVGGWDSESGFLGATDSSVLARFVSNLIAFIGNRRLDGIDIDWEPLGGGDAANFKSLASTLRAALNSVSDSLILTTTCSDGNQSLMASVQNYFDQINIMTYDMSGDYSGWVSWFNSPIYNGGVKFPGTGNYLPSIDAEVKAYKAAGVSPGKIGIGAELGGTVWQGLTLPDQLLSALTSITYDVPLYAYDGSGIMQKYYSQANYRWDTATQSSYLSVPALLGLTGAFVSYDDSNSIKAKINYVKGENLGGIILYELGMGYPGKGSYPLLESVKADFADTTATYVRSGSNAVPARFVLAQNYPNPFNPTTTISFSIPASGYVSAIVYDVLGREVTVIAGRRMNRGWHSLVWDASGFASGLYLCVVNFNSSRLTTKMLLLK